MDTIADREGSVLKGRTFVDLETVTARIKSKLVSQESDLSTLAREIARIEALSQSLSSSSIAKSTDSDQVLPCERSQSPAQELAIILDLQRERETQTQSLLEELSGVKADLESALEMDSSADEIPSRDMTESETSDSRNEVARLTADNERLTLELDNSKAKLAALTASEQEVKDNVSNLERNLGQLSSMCNHLTSQKVGLKQEVKDCEEKLRVKDDLIAYLEAHIFSLQNGLKTCSAKVPATETHPVSRASYPGSQFKKTIKGGKRSAGIPEDIMSRVLRNSPLDAPQRTDPIKEVKSLK